ncbi:MAG: DNA-processing protein DprA [Bacteroidaceae bacterium]|nr:DNA-processing protein DprA [Bacteroidaceae bacterium]
MDVAGSATELFDNLQYINDILPGISPTLVEALRAPEIMERAKREMDFVCSKGIKLTCLNDSDYPARLLECCDAPIALYSLGDIPFNAKHIVSIVGTRHATEYGKGLCRNFVIDLARMLPDTLVVSGLAYGIDICAHRAALEAGLPTVGVLAHGLDMIYPHTHRSVAKSMIEQSGGLLTEFMSETNPFPQFFVQRNRIVAGMADATVVIESASKGGSLITASMAQGYSRDCFAFPGRVSDQYSCGCNELVARNRAALITSAYDFVEAMNWSTGKAKKVHQTEIFPEFTPQEEVVMKMLQSAPDGLQVNQLVVQADMPVNVLMPLLFDMEMKGYVKAVAGGCYRSIV